MTDRHHGRLEGMLLAVAVVAASALAVGGVWRVAQITGTAEEAECRVVAEAHKDSLAQVVSLALALVALRRMASGGDDPPK
jgi:formate hydrogenlyase subunit 3/multisubunit Na+/H+ antiporter MnhD subunit